MAPHVWHDLLFESLSVGFVLQHTNTSISNCNAAAAAMLGRPKQELIESGAIFQKEYSFFENGTIFPEHAYPAFVAFATGQAVRDTTIRVLRPDYSVGWLRVSATPIVLKGEQTPCCVITSLYDVSDHKQMENDMLRRNDELSQRFSRHTKELRDVSRELARVEEAERRRFVQELHDTIGAALSALSINMTIMRNQLSQGAFGDIESRLGDSITLLDETTDATRNLMAELRPPVLDDYGLAAAIRWQADLFSERNDLKVAVDISGLENRFEPDVEISMFRIVQSALTNVSKHAKASNVDIVLSVDAGDTTLTITDNGVGFSVDFPADASAPHRANPTWGLVSMRERAEAVGGSLTINSTVGKGTQVIVRLGK